VFFGCRNRGWRWCCSAQPRAPDRDASGIRGWVRQCPASLGAGAPTRGVTCGRGIRNGRGVRGVEPGEGGRPGRPSAAEHCSTHLGFAGARSPVGDTRPNGATPYQPRATLWDRSPHHSRRSEGPDAFIRMSLDPARISRWRRSFRARHLFCMDPQGSTLGWYVGPRWGVSTGLMRPSGPEFRRFWDSLLDRCGSFAKEQKCER